MTGGMSDQGVNFETKEPGLLEGSITFFLSYVVSYLARFLTSIVVARTLGVEGKGIYSLVLISGSFIVLVFSIGLGNSITYFTANKKFSPANLFTFSVVSTGFLSIIGGLGLYLAYRWYLSDRILAGVTQYHIQLIIISLPISLLAIFLSSIVRGRQEFIAFNAIALSGVVSNLVLQGISSILRGGISGAILAWLISNIIVLGVSFWYVREHIQFIISFPRAILGQLTSYGLKSHITNIFTFFNLRLDTFFINYFTGSYMVGLYTTGASSAELVWNVPNAIGSALFPKSSAMNRDIAARLTSQVCRQVIVVSTFLTGLSAILGPFFIPLLFGSDFEASVAPFLWLLPGILGLSVSKIIAANLGGIGKPLYATYTSIITLAITIVLDILMIPVFSIVGAAIASSIAYLFSTGLLIYWFSKETSIKISDVIMPKTSDIKMLAKLFIQLWNRAKVTLL